MRANISDAELIQALATSLSESGWRAPLIVLLELLKPFSFLCSQAALLIEPLLSPWTGDRGRRYLALLEDGTNVERLLEALEGGES